MLPFSMIDVPVFDVTVFPLIKKLALKTLFIPAGNPDPGIHGIGDFPPFHEGINNNIK